MTSVPAVPMITSGPVSRWCPWSFQCASPEQPGRGRFHPFSGVAHLGLHCGPAGHSDRYGPLGLYDKSMNVITDG